MIILHLDLQPQFKYMNYFIYTSHQNLSGYPIWFKQIWSILRQSDSLITGWNLTKGVCLWGDLDQDQWSKICLDHVASKEPMNPWSEWIHWFLRCTMNQTDLGSQILIQITPKECTLNAAETRKFITVLLIHLISWSFFYFRTPLPKFP